MGKLKSRDRVKIVVGLISRDKKLFADAARLLMRKLGPVDTESDILVFNQTTYYQPEMGKDLTRKFLSFFGLLTPEGVEKIKLFTNKLEKRFSRYGKRAINIDPGYITSAKLVLLTTKDYSHRIHIGKGIYAEVTLFFQDGEFRPWQWSYPDYKTDAYKDFFGRVRNIYMEQLKND